MDIGHIMMYGSEAGPEKSIDGAYQELEHGVSGDEAICSDQCEKTVITEFDAGKRYGVGETIISMQRILKFSNLLVL